MINLDRCNVSADAASLVRDRSVSAKAAYASAPPAYFVQ
jgi:hypothetical protein